jgi:hypothetical protein
MSQLGFNTWRERTLKAYAESGKQFQARTIPYHSTAVLEFEIVDADETAGLAFAVARKNEQLSFFTYGVGEQVDLGGSLGFTRATEADTNLAKGTSTNGAQDYIIEGVGLSCRGMRVEYDGADETQLVALVADSDVTAAVTGDRPIYDPAAILMPAQAQSPLNLENGLFQCLLGQASVDFLFDRSRVEKLGTLEMLPQAGASSYLRANGAPEAANKYRIPEGYIWRRDGESDCELSVSVTLQRAVVVPISLSALWAGADDGDYVTPSKIYLEVVMRLFGLGVQMPSGN